MVIEEEEEEDDDDDGRECEEECSSLRATQTVSKQKRRRRHQIDRGQTKTTKTTTTKVGYSPGAGLSSEEAAEAAFADLINTSNDTQLSDEDMSKLSQSSRMDDDAVARGGTQDVAGGVVGDLIRLGEVLLKGGHIVKKKDGRV